jgi:hypothetical protein
MTTVTRAAQAPESYGTFWEPVAREGEPAVPAIAAPDNAPAPSPEATDAYSEFVNLTEGNPALRAERR